MSFNFQIQEGHFSKTQENLLKLNAPEDDVSISFMNLMIVNCFRTLLTLFESEQRIKNDMESSDGDGSRAGGASRGQLSTAELEFRRQRDAFLDSIKNDYRLINFSCLYKLAELTLDHHHQNSNLYTHFSHSLSSIRALLKTFIDEYFESAI